MPALTRTPEQRARERFFEALEKRFGPDSVIVMETRCIISDEPQLSKYHTSAMGDIVVAERLARECNVPFPKGVV